mmetsp:Transcript_35521/g.49311  ORF Transcript_35521/g.49311 Transcript_35521/m.49311 type:complete len:199 (-) Transcript_35521:89-685(-)|eukprot:CAMPEP_0196574080 /NCGR_PEP_ID=MMETSP1081-20130531/3861_1 /TAXON_ID=36882 /ORGANISM="Pyramimonas amylifera, Strain CCMP720" /LENGTH=198 /DNA_ID=CAMNT_0041891983 /DNA_START=86 /DNA_END=685 /DNA_ORIENTATION=+
MACFYAAGVVAALEAVWERGRLHGGLCPQHILLGGDGYIRLAGMSHSRTLPEDENEDARLFSIQGPELGYMAPEMLTGLGHDRSVDLWALGVFIYEMISGRPLFNQFPNCPAITYKGILEGGIAMKSNLSLDAQNIVRSLLKKSPNKRLGAGYKGWKEIKAHPWFANVDWISISLRNIKPPIVPTLNKLRRGSRDGGM